MKSLLSQMVAAGLGLWLATLLVAGVKVQMYPSSSFFGIPLTAQWQLFVLFGTVLGLLNYFVKPVINLIAFPLRLITLGLFGFVVSMGFVWVIDAIFKEFSMPLLYPLFWTTLIIWILNLLISHFVLKED